MGSWHRQNFDVLRPFVTLSKVELADLKAAGVYVAGVNDSNAAKLTDYYDLYIDGESTF